jgi:hypothetical protein
MKINIEEIIELQKRRLEINNIDLDKIEWFRNGVKIEPSKEDIKEFKYTGLSNIDFCGCYLLENEEFDILKI